MRNTPTNQELREKIDAIVFARFYDIPPKQRKSMVDNLNKLISDTVNKVLDELSAQSITVLPETYPTGQRTSIDAVPLSAIEKARKDWSCEKK